MNKAPSKRNKRPDNRPARARYWTTGRLAVRKIRNLVRCGRMTPEAAVDHWLSVRSRHRDRLTLPVRLLHAVQRKDPSR